MTLLRAPLPTEPLIWHGSRCIRCGWVIQTRPEVTPGKCPLFEGAHTHSEHDFEPVRLEVTVLNNEALVGRAAAATDDQQGSATGGTG